jgi:hypothetical protein
MSILQRTVLLLCLFVRSALFAVFAKLCQFEAILELLLVLIRMIIDATADRAFKFDEIFL